MTDIYNSKEFSDGLLKNNYKIVEYESEELNEYCYIYFSGNGIYDPDTVDVFKKKILSDDRYEWEKWHVKAGREIFIRDIYKLWYIKGINHRINSVEKVYEELQRLTKGYKVVTVGSSAGGYAAVLFGCLLNAEKVYSFSGQWNLLERIWKHRLFTTIPNMYKYMNLTSVVMNTETPIFYFYPCLAEEDKRQARLISGCSNVHAFAIKSKLHGKAVYANNLPVILQLDSNKLIDLEKEYFERKITPVLFSFKMVGLKTIPAFLRETIKPFVYKFKDYIRSNKAV